MDEDDDEEEEEEEPSPRPNDRQPKGLKLIPAEFTHREPTPLQISNKSTPPAYSLRTSSYSSAGPPHTPQDFPASAPSPLSNAGSKVRAVRQWVTRGTAAQAC